MEKYDDEHRIFLQAMMTKGILNFSEVHELFKLACKRCDVKLPDDTKESNDKLQKFIFCIKSQLETINLTIKKCIDEDSRTKNSFFVLVNKTSRIGESSTKMTVKAMVDFKPAELEFLRLIVDAIIEDDHRQVSQTKCLLQAPLVKMKKLSQLDAEKAIKKYIRLGWLKLTENERNLRLSIKFIAEMEIFLRSTYPDAIQMCSLCNKLVVRSIQCSDCGDEYHLYCLVSSTPNGRRSNKANCKSCRTEMCTEENVDDESDDDEERPRFKRPPAPVMRLPQKARKQ